MILVLVWLASFVASMTWWRLPLDHDDQALFRLGSAILRHGGKLYQDIWDVKQPGVYWYYETAERLFGAGTSYGGVHVLTSAWLATAAVFTAWLVRRSAPTSRAWMLAPIVTLGAYILRVSVFTLAQVEALVPLPILAVLACVAAAAATQGTYRRVALYMAAGMFAGVVATFKLILVVVPGAILALGLLGLALGVANSAMRDLGGATSGHRVAALCFVAASSGGLFVATVVFLPFMLTGRSDIFLWTQFVFPAQAIAEGELPGIGKLLASGGHLITTVALFLPAAAIGALRLMRSPSRFARSVGQSCLAWLVVGVATIVAQRFSWHAYHFTMLIWPVGVLAAAGVATTPVASIAAPRGWPSPGLAKLVMGLMAAGVLVNGARFAYRQIHPFTPEIDSTNYLAKLPALGERIAKEPCRSAIVFGSPALLHATGLASVSRLTGQLAVILPSTMWGELTTTLRERKPQYVYYSIDLHPVVRRHAPELDAWISEHYDVAVHDAQGGTWLVLRGNRPADSCQAQVPAVE